MSWDGTGFRRFTGWDGMGWVGLRMRSSSNSTGCPRSAPCAYVWWAPLSVWFCAKTGEPLVWVGSRLFYFFFVPPCSSLFVYAATRWMDAPRMG